MARLPKKKKFLNVLQRQAVDASKELLEGWVLAIDPSSGSRSSSPGYSMWHAGKLLDYGKLEIDYHEELNRRLFKIRKCLQHDFLKVDVLVIENIPPMIHGGLAKAVLNLHRSVGAVMSAFDVPLVEVAPVSWRKLLPEGYHKDDDNDAVMIGYAAIREASLQAGLPEPALPNVTLTGKETGK